MYPDYHTLFPSDNLKLFESHPAKYHRGDITQYCSKFRFTNSHKRSVIIVLKKCYILAGIMYYKVYSSNNPKVTILREDEMESF